MAKPEKIDRYSYLVLGAGTQGVAAAYDAVLFGDAEHITLADADRRLVSAGISRIKKLCAKQLSQRPIQIAAATLNAKEHSALCKLMDGHDAMLSAIPYYLNPAVAEAAVACKVNYCDLGGYFESTRRIMRLGAKAKKAGITLVSDCGVAPGMCNSLALAGIEKLDRTDHVRIYCGGLPQKPRPPLYYKRVFSLAGMLGNYFGKAYELHNGKIRLVQSFSEFEVLSMGKPLGKLEAIVTGGATSTCPLIAVRGVRSSCDVTAIKSVFRRSISLVKSRLRLQVNTSMAQ